MYPAAKMRNGLIDEVFHFSNAGYYWVRTFRGPAGWKTEPIGQQGDGLEAWIHRDDRPTTRFVFQRNRINSDIAAVVFASWDGKELRRETLDPSITAHYRAMAVLPDETVLIPVLKGSPIGYPQFALARRAPNGSWQYEPLPLGGGLLAFGCNRKGVVHLVEWRQPEARMLVWTHRKDGWRFCYLGAIWNPGPAFAAVQYDGQGNPIVVVCTGTGDVARQGVQVFRTAGGRLSL